MDELEELRGTAIKIARTLPVDVLQLELVEELVPDPLEVQWLRRAPITLTRSPAAGGFAPWPKNTLALVNAYVTCRAGWLDDPMPA